jgi:hypothetical protein
MVEDANLVLVLYSAFILIGISGFSIFLGINSINNKMSLFRILPRRLFSLLAN